MRRLLLVVAIVVLAGCGTGAGGRGAADSASADGDAAGSALTIEQAVARDDGGLVDVRGYLVADGDAVRVCDALAESYPPQCGDASLQVDGLDLAAYETQTASGVTWTDAPVSLSGAIDGGVLRLSRS